MLKYKYRKCSIGITIQTQQIAQKLYKLEWILKKKNIKSSYRLKSYVNVFWADQYFFMVITYYNNRKSAQLPLLHMYLFSLKTVTNNWGKGALPTPTAKTHQDYFEL